MSINFLHDHLLYKIMNFIQDNKTSLNFMLCCTYFKKLFYKYGYIKHIKTGNLINISIYDFFLMSIKHENTLNMIEITNVNNPMCWIAVWPKVVFFNYCNITYEIKPFHQTKTKILYLLNNRSDKKIKVDWKMFPNLEYLEVDNFNFNFEDTKQCKKLLNIRIKNKK